ncbi:MAG TPA: apolipoprotein N-acyltransferase, partial [Casimicrobiaceae bacterium]
MTLARALSLALAAAAGALSVFAFAPFGWSGLIFVTFGVLAWRWQRATSAREAAGDGFAFGAGLFGAGSSWLTVALVNFGGMPIAVAAFAIAILTAYLALWPAFAGGIAVRFTPANSVWRLLAAAGAFTATEWIRSYLFTGFPWLALGYTQVPDGIVRGYAPIGGVYLVTLAVALGAGLVAFFVDALAERRRAGVVGATAAAIVIAAASGIAVHVDWTRPAGEPVSVSLLQGNVVQELKFDPAFRTTTYERYLSLVRQSRG